MKILVTGGAGFIGSHIVDRYISLGHSVVVIDDLSSGRKEYVNQKAIFYQIDIRDKESVAQLFETEKPEVLNHHAAQMDVRRSVADPIFDADVNIMGLLNLLEAGRKNGLKKVIFASSGGTVYGETETLPTPETNPTQPTSPYGISKLTSELYLYFYNKVHNIPFVALRYGNVFGPRQNPHGEAGVVAIFTERLLKKEVPIINGDGKQTRDFVFVGDVVAANEQALNQASSLKVNIGTGKETDVNTIFDTLVSVLTLTQEKSYGPAKAGEQRRSCLDISYAKTALGWEPHTTLEAGLRKTVDFFAAQNRT